MNSKLIGTILQLTLLAILVLPNLQLGASDSPVHNAPIDLGGYPPRPAELPNLNGNSNCSPCTITLITGDRFYIWQDHKGQITNIVPEPENPDSVQSYLIARTATETFLLPNFIDLNRFDIRFFELSYLLKSGYSRLNYLPIILQSNTGNKLSDIVTSLPGRQTNYLRDAHSDSLQIPLSQTRQTFTKLAENPTISKVLLDGRVQGALLPNLTFLQSLRSMNYPGGNYPYNGTGNALLGAPSLWAKSITGKGVRVALLDTGIWETHPDFYYPNGTSKIIYQSDYTDDNTTADLFGHGTWTASILGGTGAESNGLFSGIAPGVEILNIKVLNRNGEGLESWVAAGINGAIRHKADIISMSLGGGPSPIVDQAVRNATARGIIVVAAAGNGGPLYFSVGSPAEEPSAVAVGASSIPNWYGAPPGESLLWFSSSGPSYAYNQQFSNLIQAPGFAVKPDVTAPGWQVVGARAPSTYLAGLFNNIPGFGSEYFALSGTSGATPKVAGGLALLRQAFPSWSSQLVVDDMLSTSTLLQNGWYHTYQYSFGCCDNLQLSNSTYPLDLYQQGLGRVNLMAAISPNLIISPAEITIPNAQKGSSTTTTIFNPTNAFVSFNLQAAVEDVANHVDVSSLIKLNVTFAVLAPHSRLGVQVSLKSPIVKGSFYGGYVLATASTNPEQILAHAGIGFYSLHYLTLQAQNDQSVPLVNSLVLLAPRNLTWFGLSYYSPFAMQLNSIGSVQIPVLDGINAALTATLGCNTQRCPLFISGLIDIEGKNSSLLLDGSHNVEVNFDTALSNVTTTTVFDDYRFTNFTLTTPYGTINWDLDLAIGINGPHLPSIPTRVTPASLPNSLRVAYQYVPTPLSPTYKMYYPTYEFPNLNSSQSITANYATMVTKTNLYRSAPLVYDSLQRQATSPILGGGFANAFGLSLPSNLTVILSPNERYLDAVWFPISSDKDTTVIEYYSTNGPASRMTDDMNLRPYYPLVKIDAASYSSTQSLVNFQIGPLQGSSSGPGSHISQTSSTGYEYVNGTEINHVTGLGDPFQGTISDIRTPTRIDLGWSAYSGVWLKTSTTLNMTFWADGTSGRLGSSWRPPGISNLSFANLDMNNTARDAEITAYFTAYVPRSNLLTQTSIAYSTNSGLSWIPLGRIGVVSRTDVGGNRLSDFKVSFPELRSLPLSMRITLQNIAGKTTLTLVNAIGAQYFPNPSIAISTPSYDVVTIARKVEIKGTVSSLFLAGGAIASNDTRFSLTSWNATDGSFTFTNSTSLHQGALNIGISFRDGRNNAASTTLNLTLRNSLSPKIISWPLFVAVIPILAGTLAWKLVRSRDRHLVKDVNPMVNPAPN